MTYFRYLATLVVLLLWIGKLYAQKVDFFVISTYDYKKAIQSGYNTPAAGSDKHPKSFLYVTVDGDKFDIQELESYQQGMGKMYKRRNTLFFVHGDGANIDNLVQSMKQIPELYNVNVILFAWPAHELGGMMGIRNYRQAKENAEFVFDSFIDMLDNISHCDSIRQGNVSLMFHSLGNLFAKKFAHFIATNPDKCPYFDNIILNAPAVISEDHEIWADLIASKVREGIYMNFNRKDKVLYATDIFLENRALLGRDPDAPYAGKLMYVDFTDARLSNTHTYFIGSVKQDDLRVWSYYNDVINGRKPNVSDTTVFRKGISPPREMYKFIERPN